jgi:hypothetical protein
LGKAIDGQGLLVCVGLGLIAPAYFCRKDGVVGAKLPLLILLKFLLRQLITGFKGWRGGFCYDSASSSKGESLFDFLFNSITNFSLEEIRHEESND